MSIPSIKTKRANLYDYLKIVAIVTMIIDHIGLLFFPEQPIRRIIGRTAFPLFLFLVGFNHSYKRSNQLWIRGILLQIFLWIGLWFGWTDIAYLNILLAIGLTRILLGRLKKVSSFWLEIIVFIGSALTVRWSFPYIDYGTMSIVFALAGYWARKYGLKWQIIFLISSVVVYHFVFMIISRGFAIGPLMISILLFLIGVLIIITKKNYSLPLKNETLNNLVIIISSYALQIYVLQAIVLSILYITLV